MLLLWSFLAGWAGCLVLASFLISSTKCFPAHKRTPRHPQHVRHEARYSSNHVHEKIYFGILKNRWELPLWWLFALSMLRDLFHFYSKPLASHYRSKNESPFDGSFHQAHYKFIRLCIELPKVCGNGKPCWIPSRWYPALLTLTRWTKSAIGGVKTSRLQFMSKWYQPSESVNPG